MYRDRRGGGGEEEGLNEELTSQGYRIKGQRIISCLLFANEYDGHCVQYSDCVFVIGRGDQEGVVCLVMPTTAGGLGN